MKAFSAAVLFGLVATAPVDGQCPDGALGSTCRAAATRPLDDRNWLVLPFDNLARDPSLDVVRDASVTLLYSAMSQWTDILIVDDTRVADLMRGVPAGSRIGQETAFQLARRVGAGKVVMGTLLKEGPRTRLQAAVFDVRSGRRLRSPSAMTVGTDSLSVVFTRLAQGVLELPVPSGPGAGEVLTQSTEALRAYAAGLEAERRFVQDTAVVHYRRAVALDSAFGLAHYRLSQTVGDLPDEPAEAPRRALESAQRFSSGMPRRERGQVAVAYATLRGDWASACALVDRMLAADSLDAWAWYNHGNCRLQLLATGDRARMMARFNSDNARLADWRRAAALDSTFFTPVVAITALLLAQNRVECSSSEVPCPDSSYFVSTLEVDHDTLVNRVFRPYADSYEGFFTPEAAKAWQRRVELARDALNTYLIANPAHIGAHLQLAATLLTLRDLAGAEREVNAAKGAVRLRGWRRTYYAARASSAFFAGRTAVAAQMIDSVYDDPTAATRPQIGSYVGRYSLDARAVHRGNDSLIALRQSWLSVFSGVLPADWDRLVERYATAYGAAASSALAALQKRAIIGVSNLMSFYMRPRRPAADTAHLEPLYRFQAWFALGDTARARTALRESDAAIDRRDRASGDDGAWLFNAEGHLLLADSVRALARLRGWVERQPITALAILMYERPQITPNSIYRGTGRIWLLFADLAMAAGSRDEARRGYQWVVDIWGNGEAPVQPLVARARANLAKLRS